MEVAQCKTNNNWQRFKLQHNVKRNHESDPPYHLLKKRLKNSANDSLRDVFIQWMYTQRDICNNVLEGKKLIKRFKLQQMGRKTSKGNPLVRIFLGVIL